MPIAKNVDAQTVRGPVGGVDASSVERAVERLRDLVASLEISLSEREPIKALEGHTSRLVRRAPLLRRRFE